MFYGQFTDIVGRRPALLYAALLTLFAAILQAASQNIAMFVTARVLIGLGTSASSIAGNLTVPTPSSQMANVTRRSDLPCRNPPVELARMGPWCVL